MSNHNGDIDWNQVAADGKKFTFVLATDGTRPFPDPAHEDAELLSLFHLLGRGPGWEG